MVLVVVVVVLVIIVLIIVVVLVLDSGPIWGALGDLFKPFGGS